MNHQLTRFSAAWLLAAVLFCATGCSPKAPSGEIRLNNDSLVALTTAIHLLEARLMQVRAQGDNTDTVAVALYDSLFNSYQTSREEYDTMLQILARQPDEYLIILDSVTARLERMKEHK